MVRICSLVALCSLLSSQMASTHSTVSHSQQQRSAQQQTEEEEEQHSAQQPIPVEHSSQKSKKMSGWVQTYKEPKAVPSEAVGSDKQQQREEREEAEEAEEEEEMSCTIKVQKVSSKIQKGPKSFLGCLDNE